MMTHKKSAEVATVAMVTSSANAASASVNLPPGKKWQLITYNLIYKG